MRLQGRSVLNASEIEWSCRVLRWFESVFNGLRNDVRFQSRDDLPNWLAEVNLEPFMARDFEAARIEAELVHDGGMHVGDIMAILARMKSDLVGGAVYDASFESATGEPYREAEYVMVAPI